MTTAATPARRHLLPPQATQLERAIDQTFPRWDALADAFRLPSESSPEAFAPWLAAEWGLAPFARYFPSLDTLMAAGLPWLFVRGTAASVHKALSWIGFTGVHIEEDGPYLHIDLGRKATAEEVARAAHVVRASIPAHVHFFRVFHGYDLRPIVLDRGPALDAGMLDGYSGVPGGSDVVVSFGERAGYTLPTSPAQGGRGAQTHVRVSTSRYDDMPVLDAWRLDSNVLAGVSGGVMELFITSCDAPQPGGGQLLLREVRASTTPWLVPDAVGARTDFEAQALPVPVHPAPHWAGHWGQAHGGPWEPVFWLISSEET